MSPDLDDSSKEKYLNYLCQQKDLFTTIIDEITVLRFSCKKALNVTFRKDLSVIEGRFHDMKFAKLPYVFSNKYWCILRYIGECIRLTQVLFIDCEILCSGHKIDALDKIQESLENALEYVIYLIEIIEKPKELHHAPIE